jgi:hypothetical protein
MFPAFGTTLDQKKVWQKQIASLVNHEKSKGAERSFICIGKEIFLSKALCRIK